MMQLVGDVGGTHARLALARDGVLQPGTLRRVRGEDHASFDELLAGYLAGLGRPAIAAVCIAVAGPVEGGRARLTNRDWSLSTERLRALTGAAEARLMNDLMALGIREGILARRLLRPLHPFWVDLMDNLAYKAFIMVVLIPTVIVLMIFFRPNFQTTAVDVLAFLPALVLAFILRFCLEWGLAMSAFWTTRTNAINQVYFVVFLFFSGRLAPLELLPGPIQLLASLLPFRWMLSFPLEVLLGGLTAQEIALGYAVQLGWAAVAAIGMSQVIQIHLSFPSK